MRQCYVCGDVITEPVSAFARNICRRCATAPPEQTPVSMPMERKDASPDPPPPKPKPARRPPEPNNQSVRGAACVVVGAVLTAYSILVILFGGVLHSLIVGGGVALLIVGILDLYYWWNE